MTKHNGPLCELPGCSYKALQKSSGPEGNLYYTGCVRHYTAIGVKLRLWKDHEMNWVKHTGNVLTEAAAIECADYLLSWIRRRNGAELEEAFDVMRVKDARLLREELIMILQNGGKPDNWVS